MLHPGRLLWLAAAVSLISLAAPAAGQHASPGTRPAAAASATQAGATTEPGAPRRRLPRASVTEHVLELPGKTLRFKATAGAVALTGASDRLEAEIAYVAYQRTDGVTDPASRPVAFAFNGGPGSASAWLHLGTLGPWRLRMDGDAVIPSAAPGLVPNAETWLEFTDVVLIDPAGTGYSRIEQGPTAAQGNGAATAQASEGSSRSRTNHWSVDGDIVSLGEFIRRWTIANGRHASPRMLVGESYGGFRVPRLAHRLQTAEGLGVSVLVMVSPVLDFALIRGRRDSPMANVVMLPSLAAAALEAKGQAPSPESMAPVEAYARGEFLADLMRGPRDAAAQARIIKRVAALTGLPEATVREYGGRLDGAIYRREANRARGEVASPYDASIKGLDRDPTALYQSSDDPFTTALSAPMTSAMLTLYNGRLNWKVDAHYRTSNYEANRQWRWGTSTTPPQSVTALRAVLALDRSVTALVVHGYTDLVTPYFASTLLLDQLPDFGSGDRVRQITYPGGHMFYSRDASRRRFRDDGERALGDALRGGRHATQEAAPSPASAATPAKQGSTR